MQSRDGRDEEDRAVQLLRSSLLIRACCEQVALDLRLPGGCSRLGKQELDEVRIRRVLLYLKSELLSVQK